MSYSKVALVAWGLLASKNASSGHRTLKTPVLEAMAEAALRVPLDTDPRFDGAQHMMAAEVAIAWLESGNHEDALGDGAQSYCWGQIYLPPAAPTTLEGWAGPELVAEPEKCAAVVVRLVRQSARAEPDCILCMYARGPRGLLGRDLHGEAQRLSDHRMNLAHRLIREVPIGD